jgi:hypothetical protein
MVLLALPAMLYPLQQVSTPQNFESSLLFDLQMPRLHYYKILPILHIPRDLVVGMFVCNRTEELPSKHQSLTIHNRTAQKIYSLSARFLDY